MAKSLRLSTSVRGMFRIVLWVMFFNHIVGCLWFYQAKANDYVGSWVLNNGIQDDSPYRQYIISYFWALQTLTTVGFGDIPA